MSVHTPKARLLLIGRRYYTLVTPEAPPKLTAGSKFRSECTHWNHCQGDGERGVMFDGVRQVVRVRLATEEELTAIRESSAAHARPMSAAAKVVVVELEDVSRSNHELLGLLTKHQLFYEWWLQP